MMPPQDDLALRPPSQAPSLGALFDQPPETPRSNPSLARDTAEIDAPDNDGLTAAEFQQALYDEADLGGDDPEPSVLDAVEQAAATEERPPDEDGATFNLFGTDLFGDEVKPVALAMAQRFIMPPFTVLDARGGPWQERKRAWVAAGVRGELGREAGTARAFAVDLLKGERIVGVSPEDQQAQERAAASNPDIRSGLLADGWHGRDNRKAPRHTAIPGGGTGENSAWKFKTENGYETGPESQVSGYGTSVFDPVLCELMIRWFCPTGGHLLDPFGGESTKGLVATALGYQYTGMELRQEQVDTNRGQAAAMGLSPQWFCGDSANLEAALPAGKLYDLVFTSPPYYNLEEYRGGERDGSGLQTYAQFMAWYRTIFEGCIRRLAPNRFLIVKVGEVRDKKTGAYYNFVGDNNRLFMDLGLQYWNEFVLITAIGSLPLRAGRQFSAGRKAGKSHQNVHVYYKGDPARIRDVLGPIDAAVEGRGEEVADGRD